MCNRSGPNPGPLTLEVNVMTATPRKLTEKAQWIDLLSKITILPKITLYNMQNAISARYNFIG